MPEGPKQVDGIQLREKIAIKELSAEDQERIKKLEEATDALYAKKSELYGQYDLIQDYLPKKKTASGTEIPIDWDEIEKLVKEGQIDEVIIKSAHAQIEKESQEKEYTPEQKERALRNIKRKIERKITRALDVFAEVKERDDIYVINNKYKDATPEERKKVYDGLPSDIKATMTFKWLRLRELAEKKRELRRLENQLDNLEKDKDFEQTSSNSDFDVIRAIEEEYRAVHGQYKNILLSSPEAYIYQKTSILQEAKNVLDSGGRIVETLYVKEQIDSIMGSVKVGRHVFIHGELGSGKSELAKHVSQKYLSQPHITRWMAENPEPTDEKARELWKDELESQSRPLVVSGHKGMDTSEIFGGKEIKRKEEISPEERTKIINDAVAKFGTEYKKEHKSKAAPDKTIEELRIAYREHLENPVEVIAVLGPIYKAMKEGRPVILDEMNAIPHTVLIALNDILTMKPGDELRPTIAPDSVIKVAEGFCIIATGNWKPEDGKMYIGRQTIDAAFLSRFDNVHYDYLPEREGETAGASTEAQRAEKAQNQLFQMMLAHLLDASGGIMAPKGTLEKLKGLARAAREIEDVFSEKKDIRFQDAIKNSETPGKECIAENVLSIRHLIPILTAWKAEGFKRSLDEYIFTKYITRSSARSTEAQYVYQVLQRNSNDEIFNTEQWPDSLRSTGKRYNDAKIAQKKDTGEGMKEMLAMLITAGPDAYKRDIDTTFRKPVDEVLALEYTSPLDVIKETFGPIPQRTEIAKSFIYKKESVETPEQVAERVEKLRKLDASFTDLSKSVKTIEEIKNEWDATETITFGKLSSATRKFEDDKKKLRKTRKKSNLRVVEGNG